MFHDKSLFKKYGGMHRRDAPNLNNTKVTKYAEYHPKY